MQIACIIKNKQVYYFQIFQLWEYLLGTTGVQEVGHLQFTRNKFLNLQIQYFHYFSSCLHGKLIFWIVSLLDLLSWYLLIEQIFLFHQRNASMNSTEMSCSWLCILFEAYQIMILLQSLESCVDLDLYH